MRNEWDDTLRVPSGHIRFNTDARPQRVRCRPSRHINRGPDWKGWHRRKGRKALMGQRGDSFAWIEMYTPDLKGSVLDALMCNWREDCDIHVASVKHRVEAGS